MVSIGRIELSRIPVSVWAFIIIMSYAPLITHALFPWFDYSDKYYTVEFMQNKVLSFFHTIAEQGGIVGTIGSVMYGFGLGLQALLMLMEGILTGFYPTWKLLGLDTPIRGISLAPILSAIVEILFMITLYKAYKGGLRI